MNSVLDTLTIKQLNDISDQMEIPLIRSELELVSRMVNFSHGGSILVYLDNDIADSSVKKLEKNGFNVDILDKMDFDGDDGPWVVAIDWFMNNQN